MYCQLPPPCQKGLISKFFPPPPLHDYIYMWRVSSYIFFFSAFPVKRSVLPRVTTLPGPLCVHARVFALFLVVACKGNERILYTVDRCLDEMYAAQGAGRHEVYRHTSSGWQKRTRYNSSTETYSSHATEQQRHDSTGAASSSLCENYLFSSVCVLWSPHESNCDHIMKSILTHIVKPYSAIV